MKLKIKTVTNAIEKLDNEIVGLCKCDGYFYFYSETHNLWETHSVYVYNLNQITLEMWIEEYQEFKLKGIAMEQLYTKRIRGICQYR